MEKELYSLLEEFVKEFTPKLPELIGSYKLSYSLKLGQFTNPGTQRDNKGYSLFTGKYFDLQSIYQQITYLIIDFKSTQKIYQFLLDNNIWFREYGSYQQSQNYLPSAMGTFAGGFLVRNYELNDHEFIVTPISFNAAFSELLRFIKKDTINYDIYYHLRGVTGSIPIIKISDRVSVMKADFDIAKRFSLAYSNERTYNLEMYEGDYLLKIGMEFPKSYYNVLSSKSHIEEKEFITKWISLITLGVPGYMEVGRQILISEDWPIITVRYPGPYGTLTSIVPNNSGLALDQDSGFFMKSLLEISKYDLTNLSKKIIYSLERLAKSKSAKNIDDRVVDLAIALEYLINADKTEVTLQLCLKAIKLVYDQNTDEDIYNNLKKFYSLRSQILHGNDKVNATERNLFYIDFTENIVQRAILKLIELSQKYEYNDIDKALIKSLHISKPLIEILNKSKSANTVK